MLQWQRLWKSALLLVLVVGLLSVLVCLLPRAAGAVELVVTAKGGVNVRQGPGTGYKITGKAQAGARLVSVGAQFGWYKVRLSTGQTGWVAGWLVKAVSPLAGDVGAQTPATVTVKGDRVNLRSGPSTSYPKVGEAAKGERLTVIGRSGDWFKVRLLSGRVAWVAGWLVEAVSKAPAIPPPSKQNTSRGPAPERAGEPSALPFTRRTLTSPVRVLLSTGVSAAVNVYGDYALVDGLTGNILGRVLNTDLLGFTLSLLPGPAVDQTVYVVTVEKNRQFAGTFSGPLVIAEGTASTGNWFALNAGGGLRRYRGNLIIRVQDGKLLLINELPLEEYLYGVVPGEMPFRWSLEALKAQAVAARSYALRKIQDNAAMPFDLWATQMDQVYGGLDAERPETNLAVDATAGLVLRYGGAVIPAYFHSSDGGFTENSEDVWRNWCGYIRGRPDPYDRHPENPHYGWSVSYSVNDLVYRLQERGYDFSVVTEVYPVERTAIGGRVKALLVQGVGADGVPRAEVLRNADWVRCVFRLKAPASDVLKTYDPLTGALLQVSFTGSGWGHALGMSQWGARTMAEQGLSYRDILGFYYPGVTLERW